ncbi:hypothetical protein GCM10028807_40570 [Spirosoma daeguense]
MNVSELIQAVEDQLMNAQLISDVDTLDALLADDLIAVGPDGQLLGKADDLAAHRAKVFRIETINRQDLTIKPIQDGIVVTFVLMDIQGSINNQPASGRFRYTRVWTQQQGRWRVTAAHISQVPV